MTLRDVTPCEERVLQAAHDIADALGVLLFDQPGRRDADTMLKYVLGRERVLEVAVELALEPKRPAAPASLMKPTNG